MALTDGLISYWKLDEASGNAADVLGSNTLTNTGTVSYAASQINNGAVFDGTNRTLRITDAAQTGLDITGDYTVSFWTNFTALPTAGNGMGWGGKTTSASRTYMWYLNNNAGTYYVAGYIGDGSGTSDNFQLTWTTPSTGTWYHVVVTYDASAGTAEGFINASSIGSDATLPTSIGNGTSDFYIGDDGFGDYMNGKIDEFGIWNRVLTGSEITSLYNSGTGLTYPFSSSLVNNLQGYWKFDDASGNPVDSSTNAYTLTNNGTATFSAGKINNAATLASASTQYFSRTDANVANLDFAATDFTLNGWVNWTSAIPSSGTVQSFAGKFDSGARQYLFSLYNIDGSQIHLISEIGDGGANASQQDVSWTPSTNTWYMVTLRYTTATKANDFSVNGSAQGTTQTGTVALGNGSADFRVGSGFSAGGRLFNGQMDEWGVWNRRLTDAEITTLYNGGAGLQYPFSGGGTTVTNKFLSLLGVGT